MKPTKTNTRAEQPKPDQKTISPLRQFLKYVLGIGKVQARKTERNELNIDQSVYSDNPKDTQENYDMDEDLALLENGDDGW
jgi:hypothetical protein